MREILFRGFSKNLTENQWFYGDLVQYSEDEFYILEPKSKSWDILHDGILVDKNTISQFTGLTDENGNKIFEGDKFKGDENGEYYVVKWNEDEAVFQMDLYGYNVSIGENSQEIFDDEVSHIDSNCFELSALKSDFIIGNIHEEK